MADTQHWAGAISDGAYLYSREYFRELYDAFRERELCLSNNGSWEFGGGFHRDPVGDDRAYPAMAQANFSTPYPDNFGSLPFLHLRFSESINIPAGGAGGFGSQLFAQFSDPDFPDITGETDPFTSDAPYDAYLTRAKYLPTTGEPIKTAPRQIVFASSDNLNIDATHDQFGNAAAVGQRARCRTFFTFPGVALSAQVIRWDVVECVAADKWQVIDEDLYSPDVLVNTDGDMYRPDADPDRYEGCATGDYMGSYLWRQTIAAYQLYGVMVWPGAAGFNSLGTWIDPDRDASADYHLGSVDWNSTAASGSTANTPPKTFADVLADAQAAWDARSEPPFATNYSGAPRSGSRVVKSYNPDRPDLGTQSNVNLDSLSGEAVFERVRQHRSANLKMWAYPFRQSYSGGALPPADIYEWDDMGTGLLELTWNLVGDLTGPEDRSADAPSDIIIDLPTGTVFGDITAGNYPEAPEPPSDNQSRIRGFFIPFGQGTPLGGGVISKADYRQSFDYQ